MTAQQQKVAPIDADHYTAALGFCDYPTAWRIQNEGNLVHTDPRCSAVQTHGGMLCDCEAITAEWSRCTGVEERR